MILELASHKCVTLIRVAESKYVIYRIKFNFIAEVVWYQLMMYSGCVGRHLKIIVEPQTVGHYLQVTFVYIAVSLHILRVLRNFRVFVLSKVILS